MKLILIRHGLPQRSDTTSDAPLSAQGHAQARALAQWLASEPIDALYTSPMLRVVHTAEPLAVAKGLQPRSLEGVAEYDRAHGLVCDKQSRSPRLRIRRTPSHTLENPYGRMPHEPDNAFVGNVDSQPVFRHPSTRSIQ